MFATVQREIEMELVTPRKNVAKEMVFKWEPALKDMGFAALVSYRIMSDLCHYLLQIIQILYH